MTLNCSNGGDSTILQLQYEKSVIYERMVKKGIESWYIDSLNEYFVYSESKEEALITVVQYKQHEPENKAMVIDFQLPIDLAALDY